MFLFASEDLQTAMQLDLINRLCFLFFNNDVSYLEEKEKNGTTHMAW